MALMLGAGRQHAAAWLVVVLLLMQLVAAVRGGSTWLINWRTNEIRIV